MSSFTATLDVRDMGNGRDWMVLTPFRYYAGEPGSGEYYDVPEFFVTDFASVPWGLRWLVPVHGRHGKAVVLHDYLYRKLLVPRLRADQLMLEACEVLGCSWTRKRLLYRGVRLGGWRAFNGYLRERRASGDAIPAWAAESS